MSEQCPKCPGKKIIKNGFARGKQRFKCLHCNYQYTTDEMVRGKPLWMKLEAVLLYVNGMSFNAIGKHLGVWALAVLNWVRDFARNNYEKPEPGEAIVVELDELWHFIESKKTNYGYGKHMTVILGDLSTGKSAIVIVKP